MPRTLELLGDRFEALGFHRSAFALKRRPSTMRPAPKKILDDPFVKDFLAAEPDLVLVESTDYVNSKEAR